MTTHNSFAKFVPGFDFLQNLAQTASQSVPQMSGLTQWVAPTLSVEELDKRINELRAVQFWLDQNARALAATVQALEVQKMTLATLKGMNVHFGDLAQAFASRPPVQHRTEGTPSSNGPSAPHPGTPSTRSSSAPDTPPPSAPDSGAAPSQPNKPLVDPMQFWGALTQQFQQIAAGAMQEVSKAASEGLASQNVQTQSKMAVKKPTGTARTRSSSSKSAKPATAKSRTSSPASRQTKG